MVKISRTSRAMIASMYCLHQVILRLLVGRAMASGYPPFNTLSTKSLSCEFTLDLRMCPEKILFSQFADCPSISLCDKGRSDRVSILPASESATVGRDIKLAEPVNKKRPGRRSSSTFFLMANSN